MDRDLQVNANCVIAHHEVSWRFTASGGPGGQHANKAATRAEATFDIENSTSLTEGQRQAMMNQFGPVLRVVVDDERSQLRNRELAVERMEARLASALVVQRTRRPTKPSRNSKRRRVEAKRRRSQVKANRQRPGRDD